jgi:hypothetical protein
VLLVPLAGVLFWLAFLLGGAAVERLLSVKWVAVPGTVQRSGILDCGKGGGNSMPAVQYVYKVPLRSGEATLRGDRIVFGPAPCGAVSEALAILANYPPGASITVFVDPGDVRESVLLRQVHWQTILFLLGSAMTGMVALSYAYTFAKGSQSDASQRSAAACRSTPRSTAEP